MAPRHFRQRVKQWDRWRLAVLACLAGLGLPGAAFAQPVVQAVPGGASQTLNAALARLGRDPRDLSALIDAGNAALQMGDVDAATGFFARADQLSPNNMRVKAGLAAALVRSENPFDAIPLFAEAEKAGAMDPMLNSDRGLAYDLVGDNQTAQRYYRDALAAAASDETRRRFALSQAISGDRAGMELALSPLLQKQDKGAWRTRAFALAILGRPDDAVAIANQTMPAELANGIAPYLRYMPRLTPAQQAAAANFGRFPRAADIGRDDPRVALYAPPKRVATADASLVPSGEPFGSRSRNRRDTRPAATPTPPVLSQPTRSAPPEPMPTRQIGTAPALAVTPQPERRPVAPAPTPQPIVAARPVPAPNFAAATPAPRPAYSPTPTPPPTLAPTPLPVRAPIPAPAVPAPIVAAAPSVAPATNAAPSPATPPAAPSFASASGFNLARVGSSSSQSPAPAANAPATTVPPPVQASPAPAQIATAVPAPAVPRTTAPAPAPRPRRVADSFADLTLPARSVAPAPGAVDVRRIAAPKPKPVEPAKPLHPSRIWIQVGTGRDVRAMGFTWRELIKDNADLFRGKSAWVSDWGRTNRLLTGPFTTESAAEAFLARLRKKDLDAFLWTSPAGQVVDDLPGR